MAKNCVPHTLLPTLWWVKVMIFLDMFAVALVVPLMATYFKAAGGKTESYGVLSSLYSISQLVGGVVSGFLSDNLSKRHILVISFIGSGISYLMIGLTKSVPILFCSRILVGLVKQTMTTSTLIISDYSRSSTENEEQSALLRARELSQMSSITSMSFVIGSSMGGLLYKIKPWFPSVIAGALFGINLLVCICLGPTEHTLMQAHEHREEENIESKSIDIPMIKATGTVSEEEDDEIRRIESDVNIISQDEEGEDCDVNVGAVGANQEHHMMRHMHSSDIYDDRNAPNSNSRNDDQRASSSSSSSKRINSEDDSSDDFCTSRNLPSIVRNGDSKNSNINDNNNSSSSGSSGCSSEGEGFETTTIGGRFSVFSAINMFPPYFYDVAYVVGLRLVLMLVQSSCSSRIFLNYFEERFGVPTYQLGFLSSFMMVSTIATESLLMAPLLRLFGRMVTSNSHSSSSSGSSSGSGCSSSSSSSSSSSNKESRIIVLCLLGLVLTNAMESLVPDFYSFLLCSLLPSTVLATLLSSCARGLFLSCVPHEHLGKVMGVFGALTSGVGVLSPLYGSQMFSFVDRYFLAGNTTTDDAAAAAATTTTMSTSTRTSSTTTLQYDYFISPLLLLHQHLRSHTSTLQQTVLWQIGLLNLFDASIAPDIVSTGSSTTTTTAAAVSPAKLLKGLIAAAHYLLVGLLAAYYSLVLAPAGPRSAQQQQASITTNITSSSSTGESSGTGTAAAAAAAAQQDKMRKNKFKTE